ncbi:MULTISPECIES: MarR family winged helix-turn-helix transcriptional regulator [unclassified Lacticaseibacillus]|uniref:MarR family winged helix-turn-helix transcriptional regulator n=1 Tax=unclassified Lacticaseibacillus TaxID=2759744 RepID=UPI001943BB56|nr:MULTISPECIES: MarR family transcriptional regulator [unclassified Lacticaseibacillus]
MTKPIRLNEQLCFSIYKAQKQFNHFYSQALAKYKLTYPQYITLLSLYEHGTMSVKEVGQTLNLDSGTLTPLMKRMEKDGWISRKRSAQDERRVDVSLTQKAKDMRDEIYDHVGSCMTYLDFPEKVYEAIKSQVDTVDQHLTAIPDEKLQ